MKNPILQTELLQEGNSLGSIITEGANQLVIGSSKRADLVLPGNSSAIHAMLRLTANHEIMLFDLGSENGTYVSGKKVVERQLGTGDIFSIGEHQIRVKLLDDPQATSPFWAEIPSSNEVLTIYVMENGIAQQEFSLAKGQKLQFGSHGKRVLIPGCPSSGEFLKRNSDSVEVAIPNDFIAEVYSNSNQLLRKAEKSISFKENEKLRLFSSEADREVLCSWQAIGARQSRTLRDADEDTLKKSLASSAALALAIAALFLMTSKGKEQSLEASTPKSSYERLTMDSAPPAAAKEEAAASAPAATSPQPMSNAVAKLFKKSSIDLSKIQQAVSNSGKETSRSIAAMNTSLQQKDIQTESGGGSGISASAVKAGLGGGVAGGSLKGFAGGTGHTLGSMSTGNGKGFDMKVGEDEAEAVGGLDKSLIAAVVQANIGQIKHCYEKQLLIDANLSGKIVAGWTISASGTVSEDSVKKTTMNNQTVENCILGKIKSWNFPKPKGGGVVLVSYPFLFKALK